MSILDEYTKYSEYNGHKKGQYLFQKARFFGRDCTQLVKVQGFCEKNCEWFISFSRVNKRTLKIGNKTAIMESMPYKSFIENMPNFN